MDTTRHDMRARQIIIDYLLSKIINHRLRGESLLSRVRNALPPVLALACNACFVRVAYDLYENFPEKVSTERWGKKKSFFKKKNKKKKNLSHFNFCWKESFLNRISNQSVNRLIS